MINFLVYYNQKEERKEPNKTEHEKGELEMKININGYDVEIKAKKYTERFNKVDTLTLLNYLSILIDESAELDMERGFNKVAEFKHEDSLAIYELCKEQGLYD